jgi:hypothetical protein
MKYVKMLGLLALAAAALMALASPASATRTTFPQGELYTDVIHAHSEGHVVLHNPIAKIECTGTVSGKIESDGPGAAITAKGNVTPSFSNCTNSWHVTTVAGGTLELHFIAHGVSTLTSNGATVESTRFGITCRYATANTHIGTLTDSSTVEGTATKTATIHINGAIPFHSGSPLCGSGSTQWTGAYKITTPDTLWVDL